MEMEKMKSFTAGFQEIMTETVPTSRFFSIGEDGHLSRIKEFNTNRLDALRLRINALTAGDMNGDGTSEVVAAGRTVEKDIEHAALLSFRIKP
jgi:hypothetical protein